MNKAPLFDDIKRSDDLPGSYVEDSFSFLNRCAGSYWAKIRGELDAWYRECPDPTGDLRARFRNPSPRQHYGAWWEVYLHHLFTRLGFDVTPNTALPDGRSRPDFLVSGDEGFFYIEATTVFSGIVPSQTRTALEPKILDIINTLDASNFFLSVHFLRSSTALPKRNAITRPIERWMEQFDPDDLLEPRRAHPETRITVGEWEIELRLLPRSRQFRDRSDNRLVGAHGAGAGVIDDVKKIHDALERKKRQHKAPDGPMVIAVMALNGFVDDNDFVGALFGSEAVRLDLDSGGSTLVRNPDGFWVGGRGVASRKVSAVLAGISVLPSNCARKDLRIWHHFAPDQELTGHLPFAAARVIDDQLVFEDALAAPNEMLDLPQDWPGRDPRFKQ